MSTATRENARVGATLFDLLMGPLRSSCGLAPALGCLAAPEARVLEVACGISAPSGTERIRCELSKLGIARSSREIYPHRVSF